MARIDLVMKMRVCSLDAVPELVAHAGRVLAEEGSGAAPCADGARVAVRLREGLSVCLGDGKLNRGTGRRLADMKGERNGEGRG